MKKLVYLLLVILTCLVAGNALAGKGSGPGPGNGNPNPGDLTLAEAATLRYMREEEKLARDTYIELYETWHAGVFLVISRQEQRHMNSMLNMLHLYQLDDPAEGNGPGEFTDPFLQELYNDLVALGHQSLGDAYAVGVIVEETDIVDLQAAISGTAEPPLINNYSNLLYGSYNHLAAFLRSINAMGDAYESDLIDPDSLIAEWEIAVMGCGKCGRRPSRPAGPNGSGR